MTAVLKPPHYFYSGANPQAFALGIGKPEKIILLPENTKAIEGQVSKLIQQPSTKPHDHPKNRQAIDLGTQPAGHGEEAQKLPLSQAATGLLVPTTADTEQG